MVNGFLNKLKEVNNSLDSYSCCNSFK